MYQFRVNKQYCTIGVKKSWYQKCFDAKEPNQQKIVIKMSI
jgi:hypothetical protein